MPTLSQKSVVLGVTGSIATYKSLYLTRLLHDAGARVHPVLTPSASRFVGPLSFAALAGRAAVTDLWSSALAGEIGHVELAHQADVIVIAPASANTLARLAQGVADDPLSALVLSSDAPKLVAPAMESGMWENPATQGHVATLRQRGFAFLLPTSGALASGREGMGRMVEPPQIFAAIEAAVTPPLLAGQHVLVTAGPTREAFDPARYVSNPSTGKMGYALAAAARRYGASVHLISGPTHLAPPWDVEFTRIETCDDLLAACQAALPHANALFMAAAPADFRPAAFNPSKLKKRGAGTTLTLTLESTPDILLTLQGDLANLAPQQKRPLMLGFAAETDDVLTNGQEKLQRKNLDMLVANQVGAATTGFGTDTNAGWLLRRNADPETLPLVSKDELAERIVLAVAKSLSNAAI